MCTRFLQTLGHLEKAVVLELTLKHVKALTSLLEQQQQKILALQNGMQIGEPQVTRCTQGNLHGNCRANVSAECQTLGFLTVPSVCVYRAASRQPGKV